MIQQTQDEWTTAYNMPLILNIRGDLNTQRIYESLKGLVERHEALRTSFHMQNGCLVQKIHSDVLWDWEVMEADEEAISWISQKFIRSFDLETGPLFRAQLLRLEARRHILLLDMHHIISDGVSMGVLFSDLARLYQSESLPPLRIQYKDYAVWQQSEPQQARLNAQKDYWLKQYEDGQPVLELSTDRLRPAVQEFAGSTYLFSLDKDVWRELKSIAVQENSTVYMWLFAIYHILLSKYTGQHDMVIGSPIAGRSSEELQHVAGMFVNTLAIRSQSADQQTFRQFLAHVKQQVLQAQTNGDYPFEELVDQLNLRRDLSRHPLFDTILVMQNMEYKGIEIKGLDIRLQDMESFTSKFDMTWAAIEQETLHFNIEFSTSLFNQSTIEQMSRHYVHLLNEIVSNPNVKIGELKLAGPEDWDQLEAFNNTTANYPQERTLHHLFEEHAERHPERTAIVMGAEHLTYGELNVRANRLAHVLLRRGVQPDQLVGLITERSPEMIVAILAIFKAGGAYLPIDPSYPADRIRHMLADSGTALLLVQQPGLLPADCGYAGEIIDLSAASERDEAGHNPITQTKAEHLAYVMYTSGSTGQPKGVMTTHRNVVKTIIHNGYLEITAEDRLLQLSNYAFDGSTFDIYGALLNGAALVLLSREELLDPMAITRLLQEQGVTVTFMTVALFNTLVELDLEGLTALRKLVFGGEQASRSHVEKALRVLGEGKLINGYGPTETTVFATTWAVDRSVYDTGVIPIGRPLNNTTAYIVNTAGQLQPIGVAGELCVGGDGVARGYLNRPELTAERFVENPWNPGTRMYRTGDLARWREDGTVEYLGRLDEQVKIRGHRIELGEIETALLSHPGIREAVVTAARDAQGHSSLRAYVVSDEEWSATELRRHLGASLPGYMIPDSFTGLERLPLTPNGKVDKRALPEPQWEPGNEYIAPSNEIEEQLAALFSEVLGVPRVSVQDTFFELGGHSLKAMTLASRIHKELNIQMPLRELFGKPTVEQLAQLIMEMRKNESHISQSYTAIKATSFQKYYPVSHAQRRMYLAQQTLDTQSTAYNMPLMLDISGELDVERLRRVLMELLKRHESLRTSFHMVEDQLVQQIHEHVSWDWTQSEATEAELSRIRQAFIQPFELESAPLFRAELVRLDTDGDKKTNRHLLMLDTHHIISDGVSTGILLQDLTCLYEGAELPPLRIQYKDYAVWQRSEQQQAELDTQQKYWLELHEGELPILELPTDKPRPAVQQYVGEVWDFELDEQLTRRVQQLSRARGATLYMTLLAAYQLLLSKYSGQEDIIVGTPIAGRSHADLEEIVGMFVNTLTLRSQPKAELTFETYLAQVRAGVLQAYTHAEYPFEELVDQLKVPRNPGRHPVFDTMFTLQNLDLPGMEMDGLTLKPHEFEWTSAKFDLNWTVVEGETIRISIEYSTSLYERESIQRIGRHYIHLLEQAVQQPTQLLAEFQLATPGEAHMILRNFNDTREVYPQERTLHHLFEEHADRHPERTAIVMGAEHLTYGELNVRANRLAHMLLRRGVQPDQLVGLITERSPEMIVAILAIFKAGGAYLPIDPSYPMDRIRHMLADSGTALLLVQQPGLLPADCGYAGEIIDLSAAPERDEAGHNPITQTKAEHLAYVMYTSGSTGQPKGVMTTHRNVVKTIIHNGYLEITPEDRVLQLSNYAFDGSTFDIYGALLNGAALVLLSREELLDPAAMMRILQEQGVTVTFMTAALFNTLVELDLEGLTALRKLAFGGEQASRSHVEKALRVLGEGKLINGYGPTETTVFATTWAVDRSVYDTGVIPIGRPLNNTTAYIVNTAGQLQPIGVAGELCVGGDGVARGYLNRPELTVERFVENPWAPGTRMYRTGDLARWREDGTVEYLGRLDEQVKIRGHRIELGEIETVLLSHPGIREAVVTAARDAQGHSSLRAYVVSDEEWSATELRRHLGASLPEYMIPDSFTGLERLPLTPNGKVDKRALPEPQWEPGNEYIAPSNEIEEQLAALFSEVLGVPRVSVQDTFFELGGHSLKAMTLAGRIHKDVGIKLQLRELFEKPTVKELASLVAEKQTVVRNPTGHYTKIEPVQEQTFYPMSHAQRRMYMIQQIKEGGATVYNMPIMLEITGDIDTKRMRAALKMLIVRHESLRTSFHMVEDQLVQQIHEHVSWDWTQSEATEAELSRIRQAFIRPFELESAPLFRAELVRLDTDGDKKTNRHLLMLDTHHIISDGVSTGILLQDLTRLYEGAELPPLRIQYKDYAVWQRSEQQQAELDTQQKYWLELHEGELPILELPTDKPRPAVQQYVGEVWDFELDEQLTRRVQQLSRARGATLYMTLLAAYQLLLSKYSGQEDIIVGTPIAGRSHADLEEIVGMFVNTLTLRSQPKAELTFETYLAQVRAGVLQAYTHAEYPFEELVDQLKVPRNPGRHPVFDTMFTLQNLDLPGMEMDGLTLKPHEFEWTSAKFDLNWTVVEGETIRISIEYSTSLYERESIQRIGRHYIHLLEQAVQQPTQLLAEFQLATPGEAHMILRNFNDTWKVYPQNQTINGMFEAQVQLTPNRVAVTSGDKCLTYHQLNDLSNRLARTLRAEGVGPDQPVGILVQRSLEMVVGIYAILKAGGAYVPIDPNYPQERIRFMLEDAGVKLVLTQSELAEQASLNFNGTVLVLNGTDPVARVFKTFVQKTMDSRVYYQGIYHEDGSNLEPWAGQHHIAYVIYTSGSTGKPKGVMVEHHSVINRILWMHDRYGLSPEDTILQKTAFTFDVSVWELFWWSMVGSKVSLLEVGGEKNPEQIVEAIAQERVSTIHFVPAMLQAFLEYLEQQPLNLLQAKLGTLKHVFASGEALPPQHVARFQRLADLICHGAGLTSAKLINLYGPTEATVDVSYFDCEPTEEYAVIPIGKPIQNIHLYIVKEGTLHLQPIGVAGELCISGVGVARGYLNRPELTSEKFVANPFTDGELGYERMYRTGDLARWMPDGNIEYLGRIDHQVKIRGYRIELGEVETQLLKVEIVREAVVVARVDETGQKQMVAYYVAVQKIGAGGLRNELGRELPNYMVPAYFVQLEQMPLSPNGKIDRKALPAPEGSLQSEADYIEPCTVAEQELVAVWQSVLGVKTVGVLDNFFDLGGDSIKAIQISSRLFLAGYKLETHYLFKYPTIRELAPWITLRQASIEQGAVEGVVPLTPIQTWFLASRQAEPHHFNQDSFLFRKEGWDPSAVRQVLSKLTDHHDALRMVYSGINSSTAADGDVVQFNRGVAGQQNYALEIFDFREAAAETEANISSAAAGLQSSFSLEEGPLLKAGIFQTYDGDYLLIVIHHFVVDGVSWRILLEDFHLAYQQATQHKELMLPDKTTSFKVWSESLSRYANSENLLRELPYWRGIEEMMLSALPVEGFAREVHYSQDFDSISITLNEDETTQMLTRSHRAYRTEINDLLLASLGLAIREWTQEDLLVVHLEGHGREPIDEQLDLTRTVGWFTSLYPVILSVETTDLSIVIKTVKETLRRVPNKGIGHGILKYTSSEAAKESVNFKLQPQIMFNYLGVFDSQTEDENGGTLSTGSPLSPLYHDSHLLAFNGLVTGGQLHMNCRFDTTALNLSTVNSLMERFKYFLLALISHCSTRQHVEFTPHDFTENDLSQGQLDDLLEDLEDLTDLEDIN
uniref:Amino acid adenylation domain-containing protein n=1 Tax=Paenibacillus polymyxa TaxID=1406 RepID=A0AAE9IE59_PAEPO